MSRMQIVNRGIIFVTLCLEAGGNKMGNPEEWARSLGEEIKSKQRVDREIAQSVAMRREIEAEKMPLKWEEVLSAFQQCCTAYNEQVKPERTLGLHRVGSHEFMIRPDALPEIITGKYDLHTKFIEIRSSIGKETYFPSVNMTGSGDVELVSYETKQTKNPTSIAQDTLRECLIAP
jgi:hypothetical protein